MILIKSYLYDMLSSILSIIVSYTRVLHFCGEISYWPRSNIILLLKTQLRSVGYTTTFQKITTVNRITEYVSIAPRPKHCIWCARINAGLENVYKTRNLNDCGGWINNNGVIFVAACARSKFYRTNSASPFRLPNKIQYITLRRWCCLR